MQDFQIRDKIHKKQNVIITAKERNGDEISHQGVVDEILTATSEHYRGIKVKLTDGTVGRVKQIIQKHTK